MNEILTYPYSVGRALTTMAAPFIGEDFCVAAQRLDKHEIQRAAYRHCTFINISFKEALLEDCIFSDCIFFGCYFRRAILKNCKFEGCRFYDCEFPRVSLAGCRFYYVKFVGCQIASSEMEHSLPSEPNLREDLCRNLRRQSTLAGLTDDARRYGKLENSARETHFWNGFTGQSEWYKTHFTGWDKVRSLRGYIVGKLNGFLWGYSDSGMRLATNFLLCTFVVFPSLYWLLGRFGSSGTSAPPTIGDCILLSISTATPGDFVHVFEIDQWLETFAIAVQSLYSIVLVAMFAAFLFQWSARR